MPPRNTAAQIASCSMAAPLHDSPGGGCRLLTASRWPPARSGRCVVSDGDATGATRRTAIPPARSWLSQRYDGADAEDAVVKCERLADTPFIASHSRAQHGQAGVAQPVGRQVLRCSVILDQGDDIGLFQRA